MQILFVHPNCPAQFGPVLSRLAAMPDVDCRFMTRHQPPEIAGVRIYRYAQKGGATAKTHHCSRTFENAVWSAHGVYEACKQVPDLRPDLIVGHSGFGTTVFLQELYDCPILNYFEYYYHPHNSDMDFRPEFPAAELDILRSHARNAMILLDLQTCTAGYTPTRWQWDLFPENWRSKIEIIHDGVDTAFWRRREVARVIRDEPVPDDVRIVTYVARGLEAVRGFDVFIRVANRIATEMDNVLFVVVGADSTHYGNDVNHISERSFRDHVLLTERPNLQRFRFLGSIPPDRLADLLSLSDLHIYLTAPFVLSWSLLNALACECVVLASDTAPVREVIRDGDTGLLRDFFDVDGMAEAALRVLRDPAAHRGLAAAGRAMVEQTYGLDTVFPRLWGLYRGAAERR